MNTNQSILVLLVDSLGKEVRQENIFFTISFYLKGKYRYAFRVGGTNENGSLLITYDDVEKCRLDNLKLQSWDYKTTLNECDRQVKLSVPTKQELIKAYEISSRFNMGNQSSAWLNAANDLVKANGDMTVDLIGDKTFVKYVVSPTSL